MPMPMKMLTGLLKKKFPDAIIKIKDMRGDENHYHATIKSKDFNTLSKVQQHKLVYDAIGEHMGTTLHALKLTTLKIEK